MNGNPLPQEAELREQILNILRGQFIRTGYKFDDQVVDDFELFITEHSRKAQHLHQFGVKDNKCVDCGITDIVLERQTPALSTPQTEQTNNGKDSV